MINVQKLYQKIILMHAKNPQGFGKLSDYNYFEQLKNPDCGDELAVYAKVEQQRLIQIGFEGQGCIISQASASMMVEALTGKSLSEAQKVMSQVQALMLGHNVAVENLGDLAVFETLHQFPTRVRCGMLAWHALEGAWQKGDK